MTPPVVDFSRMHFLTFVGRGEVRCERCQRVFPTLDAALAVPCEVAA